MAWACVCTSWRRYRHLFCLPSKILPPKILQGSNKLLITGTSRLLQHCEGQSCSLGDKHQKPLTACLKLGIFNWSKKKLTSHTIFCDLEGEKTFTTRWLGGRIQSWVQVCKINGWALGSLFWHSFGWLNGALTWLDGQAHRQGQGVYKWVTDTTTASSDTDRLTLGKSVSNLDILT